MEKFAFPILESSFDKMSASLRYSDVRRFPDLPCVDGVFVKLGKR